MSVAQILRHKGSEVVTVRVDTTIAEAAQTLARRNIGAVIVMSRDGSIAGVLSERDIVKALARTGSKALVDPVTLYMTARVETCEPEDRIDEIMERMTEGRFRHMPVCEESRLVGIISIGDVVKRRIADAEYEARSMMSYIATAG